jgi:SAM-dependent methyltransferase
MMLIRFLAILLTLTSLSCADPTFSTTEMSPPSTPEPATSQIEVEPEIQKDVPYVPTSHETVAKMLEMASIDKNDLVYDLGSGDGRIVIAAAKKYGARGVGIDIDPERIAEANANAKEAGVTDRVRFIQGDLFQADLRPATAVTLYLLSSVNLRLRPTLLEQLRPGTPVVSHDFDMGEWEPDQETTRAGDDIFLWIIPAKVGGAWTWALPEGTRQRAEISQQFQRFSGRVGDQPIQDASLRGEEIAFNVGNRRFSGRVNGDSIQGTVQRAGETKKSTWTAQRAR